MTVGELRRKLALVPANTKVTMLHKTSTDHLTNHFTESSITLRISLTGRRVLVLPQPPAGAKIEEEDHE